MTEFDLFQLYFGIFKLLYFRAWVGYTLFRFD